MIDDVLKDVVVAKRGSPQRKNGRKAGGKRRVDYAALWQRAAARGLEAVFEYDHEGLMPTRVIDDALAEAGYEPLPDRGSQRGDMIRAVFPHVERHGKGAGRWGLKLRERQQAQAGI